MSIISNPTERADWIATVGALTLQIQRLETRISIALPFANQRQAELLMRADQQLGVAVKALNEAAAAIRRLR